MAEESQWTPAPVQIVSDLGQLTAFGDPDTSRILRVLQRQQATARELSLFLDIPEPELGAHLQRLVDLVLVRIVGTNVENGETEEVYRATARMFSLRPEPRDMETISSSVASTMLGTLASEIMASISVWPDQKLNFEWRRTRLPMSRVVEFTDRLAELVSEFWGDNRHQVEEDPDDPMMSFVSVWYRLPE